MDIQSNTLPKWGDAIHRASAAGVLTALTLTGLTSNPQGTQDLESASPMYSGTLYRRAPQR